MIVGVPTEVKDHEYRVALTPAGARELTSAGHRVLVQAGAGEGSAISDDQYRAAGAEIVGVEDVWSGAGLILAGLCTLRLAPRAHRLSWRVLWSWALAVQVFGFFALALTSTDVFVYLCLGALRLAGLSPNTSTPAALGRSALLEPVQAEVWVHESSPYGPLFHSLAAAADWIGAKAGSPSIG